MRVALFSSNILGHNWDWPFPSTDFLFDNINILSNYTWWNYNLGQPSNLTVSYLLPYNLLVAISKVLGTKFTVIALILAVLTIAFISFKKLLDSIVGNSDLNYLPALIYAFSPFLFNEVIGGAFGMWLSYAFTPLMAFYLLKYVSNSKPKYLVGFLLASCLVVLSLQNFILLEVVLFLYLLYKNLIRELTIKATASRYLWAHTFFFIINLFWLLPFLATISSFVLQVKAPYAKETFLAVKVSTQSILKIFMLVGYLDRDMYYHALSRFVKGAFIISSISIWLLIILSFLSKKRFAMRGAAAWMFILLLFILLIKGGNPPFADYTMWFYYTLPFMKIYRSPQHMMLVAAFITPILFGFSINFLYQTYKYKKVILSICIIAVSGVTSGWWYYGDFGHRILQQKQRDYVDFYNASPSMKKIYKVNEESSLVHRVLFLPATSSPQFIKTNYQNSANGTQSEYLFLKNPTFTAESNSIAKAIQIDFENDMPFNYTSYLRLFAVKYIFVRSDVEPHFTESAASWDFQKVNNALRRSTDLDRFIKDRYVIGYRIRPKYFLPYVYATNQLVFADAEVEELAKIAALSDNQSRKALFFPKLKTAGQGFDIFDKSSQILIAGKTKNKSDNKQVVRDYLIRRAGKYEILVFAYNQLWEKTLSAFDVKADNRSMTFEKVVSRPNGWLSLGVLALNKGRHKFSFSAIGKHGRELYMSDAFIGLRLQKKVISRPPELAFYKVNPTKYEISLSGARNPYLIVLSENYNSGWKAYNGRINWIQSLWTKPAVSEDRHLAVNGYANAWFIDKTNQKTLTLYYWPQTLFYLGLIISSIMLLSLVLYLGFYRFKLRK